MAVFKYEGRTATGEAKKGTVEAKDQNDAIQIGSRIPSAKTGCIEVRPIMVFSH